MTDKHEIVINTCYGGFGLSEEAEKTYKAQTGANVDDWQTPRDDPTLLKIVKELGTRADGQYAALKVVQIPAQYAQFYTIREYDGNESVRIEYNAYKIHSAKRMLLDPALTQRERISRALAVLNAGLD